MKSDFFNQGQISTGIIILVVLSLLIGGGLFYYFQKETTETPKVTEKETEEVFFNEYVIFFDKKHSQTEERYVLYGATHNKRLLTVIFTIRKSFIRIISARDQSKKEKAYYFKNKKLSI